MKLKLFVFLLLLFHHCDYTASGKLLDTLRNFVKIPTGILKFLYQDFQNDRQEFPETKIKNNSEFDIIIIGAGAAGCVLAHRLSEIENITVLLIEAGGKENLIFDVPLFSPYNQFLPINHLLESEYSDKYCLGLRGHHCQYPQGQGMGGTTLINAMMAIRGNPDDYNRWAEAGNTGWAYKDVLKYFKKMENFHNDGSGKVDVDYRGTNGPLHITFSRYVSNVAKAFLEAGQEIGFPLIDYNGKKQIGFSELQTTTMNGERVSANRAYLHPIRGRKNLFVTRHSLVIKILVNNETNTAYGVNFKRGSKTYTVTARLETIVSAGAIRTPQLLMVSGIGPADQLSKFKIPIVKDIPRIGKNFQDHMTYAGALYLINDKKEVHNVFEALKPWTTVWSDFLNKRRGLITAPFGVEALTYMNLKNESARDGPVTTEIAYADIPVLFADPFYPHAYGINSTVYKTMYRKYWGRDAFSLLPVLLKPESRGEIKIRSNNINDPPIVDPNYFDKPADVEMFTKALRKAHSITKTRAMQKFNATLVPEPVYGCEHFTFDSNEYWNCSMRTLPFTFWHFVGTCKMGPSEDPDAVVSPRLKVGKNFVFI